MNHKRVILQTKAQGSKVENVVASASRQRVRRRALVSLGQVQATALWTVILALQKAYEMKGADMSAEMTLENLLMLGEETRKNIVASASPEERLAGLAPEERLAGLAPEEIERLLLKNEQLRKDVVAHAPPEERLVGLEPKERLVGLNPQELLILLKQIEAYLQSQQPPTEDPPAAPTQ